MLVRALSPADVPALAAALSALPLMRRYGRTGDSLQADLASALERGDSLLAAAPEAAEGAVEGLCWFLPQGTFALGGYLRLLAVAPGAQSRGVGGRLLEAFEAEVARVSRHAFLLASDFNEGAQRFYERRGYTRVGALPGLVLPGVSELVYWKRLSSP